MTKDEFVTEFNALFTSSAPDALAVEKLRNAVSEDYDTLLTAQTAVASFTSANEQLKSANKALQETNMKLIMLHPDSIRTTQEKPLHEESSDETSLTDEQKDEAMNKVLEGFGIKKGD